MPVLPEIKFYKYVINLDDRKGLPPDKLLKELKEHADKLQLKGIKMKILADDFMSARNNISCNGITNDAITPYHNHDFYEMNYVVKGECVQYIEGKSLIMKEHDLLLLPPEAFHAPCPVGDSKCINILFRAEWIKTLEEKFSKYDKNSFLSFLIKNNVYMLFGNISEGPASESPGLLVQNLRRPSRFDAFDDVYAESTAVKLFVELSKCKRNDTHFSVRSHNVGADNPEIIFQYIRDNISSVTLEGASAHFGYTGAHLSRLIKKYTGNSFAMFLRTQRIMKAESLLKTTNLTIGEIAALSGLDSKEYFCRLFKKVNRVTPSEYRKRNLTR